MGQFSMEIPSPNGSVLGETQQVRLPLSLRNVEDLLQERGIDVSHETVRFWWGRLRSYGAALKGLGRGDDCEMDRWANNRAEIHVADLRFAPAVPTTGTGDAAVPVDARLTKICLGPRPGPKPFQLGSGPIKSLAVTTSH